MGCSSSEHNNLAPSEQEPNQNQTFKILKVDTRRAQGDVYVVTVEKTPEVVFPLGGAIIMTLNGQHYISHIIEYSRESLKFCFLAQNNMKFIPNDLLHYETIKTTPRLKFPNINVLFISHSISVAILLQLIEIYKVNLRENIFLVTAEQQGDVPYLTVLQKALIEAKSQVIFCTSDIVEKITNYAKDSSAIVTVGPVWLVKLTQQLAENNSKQSWCLPFFAGAINYDESQWLQDSQECRVEEYEKAEIAFAEQLDQESYNSSARNKEIFKLDKEIEQLPAIEQSGAPKAEKAKRPGIKAKKLPKIIQGFPEMFQFEVLEAARIENALCNSANSYRSTKQWAQQSLRIQEAEAAPPRPLRIAPLHFQLENSELLVRVRYPFSAKLGTAECYYNENTSQREYQRVGFERIVARQPAIVPLRYSLNPSLLRRPEIPYPFTSECGGDDAVELLAGRLWHGQYERLETQCGEVVIAEAVLPEYGISTIHFSLDNAQLRLSRPYPFEFSLSEAEVFERSGAADIVRDGASDAAASSPVRQAGSSDVLLTKECEDLPSAEEQETAAPPQTTVIAAIPAPERPLENTLFITPLHFRLSPERMCVTEETSKTAIQLTQSKLSASDLHASIINQAKPGDINDLSLREEEAPITEQNGNALAGGENGGELGGELPVVPVVVVADEQPEKESSADFDTLAAQKDAHDELLSNFISDGELSIVEKQKRQTAYQAFLAADADGSGEISLAEARKTFEQLEFSEEDIDYVFELVDADESLTLDFYEFYRLISILTAYQQKESIMKIMFLAADKDFSQSISREEFLQVLLKMGAQVKYGEDAVRKAVEKNVNESVKEGEFEEVFTMVKRAMKAERENEK